MRAVKTNHSHHSETIILNFPFNLSPHLSSSHVTCKCKTNDKHGRAHGCISFKHGLHTRSNGNGALFSFRSQISPAASTLGFFPAPACAYHFSPSHLILPAPTKLPQSLNNPISVIHSLGQTTALLTTAVTQESYL